LGVKAVGQIWQVAYALKMKGAPSDSRLLKKGGEHSKAVEPSRCARNPVQRAETLSKYQNSFYRVIGIFGKTFSVNN
jgi:hypothetical protein